jgi:transcriptional regulator with XRE-family HTH domain
MNMKESEFAKMAGKQIKAAREAAGLTQAQLGEKIGVTGVSIMRYEKGQRQLRFSTLVEIANALNTDVGCLYGVSESELKRREHIFDDEHNDHRNRFPQGKGFRKLTDIEAEEMGILIIDVEDFTDRIAYYYSQLNTEGRLVASRVFFQHLDPESLPDVADSIKALAHRPQYQQTGESTELTGDTSEPQADHENPTEDE